MINNSKMMFIFILILSSMIVVSSESWLGMWMGLEMNLISFIPILYSSKNNSSSESCMIYFLTQSLGSILMLMSILMDSSVIHSPLMTEEYIKMMIMLSLMVKLGVPPCHFWFPEILEKMNWVNCTILMTWQKVAPLTILSHVINNMLLPAIIIMTAMVGCVGGLNQTSLRKIMAFSSISHMSWMLACMKFNNEFWIKYLMIYTIILIMLTFMFKHNSTFYINQMINSGPSLIEKMTIIMLFMSLGGMPPFIGFLPKWIVIQSMATSNSATILIFMAISVLITLFYYLRLIWSCFLFSSMSMKWYKYNSLNSKMIMLMITINASLPVISIYSF